MKMCGRKMVVVHVFINVIRVIAILFTSRKKKEVKTWVLVVLLLLIIIRILSRISCKCVK